MTGGKLAESSGKGGFNPAAAVVASTLKPAQVRGGAWLCDAGCVDVYCNVLGVHCLWAGGGGGSARAGLRSVPT